MRGLGPDGTVSQHAVGNKAVLSTVRLNELHRGKIRVNGSNGSGYALRQKNCKSSVIIDSVKTEGGKHSSGS